MGESFQPHQLRRRIWRPLVAVGAALLMAACGGGHEGPSPDQAQAYMHGLEKGSTLKPGTDVNALYADAMALKAKGDCTAAVPRLRQVAALGPGYEGAQTGLGECLIQGAPGADLSADYLEGLTWLRRAGDAGWPEAQADLADAHALGPTAIRNAEEAGFWLALYKMNTGKSRVGFVAMPKAQLAAVAAAIQPAAKAAGEKRAQAWERKVWQPPAAPATDDKGKHGRAMSRNPMSDE